MNIQAMLQVMLIVASGGLAVFCVVLARRLRRLNDLESGLGGAIAVMAAEVDRLERAIRVARAEATSASEALAEQIALARKERAIWERRQNEAVTAVFDPRAGRSTARRLRKRVAELADA